MLSAIPGISTQTARSLLDHFGSVVALADATEPDLQGVPGVGAARASAMLEAFHRASSPMAKKVV